MTVNMLMEKEQRQRASNVRNQSAIGASAMTGQSPYRGSVASRNDGRPPTRPITPIKSGQQGRYPQYTASNTSQITNSMIGNQDESQVTQQPPNLGIGHQASAALASSQPLEADEERNIPSELRSRPKIPRTPAEGDQRREIA